MTMLVMVDEIKIKPTQWGYINQNNVLETVTIEPCDTGEAVISMRGYSDVRVYTKDIPNLIKALQAAYDSTNWKHS